MPPDLRQIFWKRESFKMAEEQKSEMLFKESVTMLHGFTRFPNQDLRRNHIINDNSKLILQCYMATFSWIHKKNRTDEAQTHVYECDMHRSAVKSLLLVVRDFDFVQTCVNG